MNPPINNRRQKVQGKQKQNKKTKTKQKNTFGNNERKKPNKTKPQQKHYLGVAFYFHSIVSFEVKVIGFFGVLVCAGGLKSALNQSTHSDILRFP